MTREDKKQELDKGYRALSFLVTIGYFSCVVIAINVIGITWGNPMALTIGTLGVLLFSIMLYVFVRMAKAIFIIRDITIANDSKTVG